MDFGDLFTLFLFFLFFILPTILKQVKAKKEKKAGVKKGAASSFFGKIGQEIRHYVEELEKQAKANKKEPSDEQDFWETIAGEEDENFYKEADLGDEEQDLRVTEKKLQPKSEPVPRKVRVSRQKAVDRKGKGKKAKLPDDDIYDRVQGGSAAALTFRENPLQNAIVLSEILSKPLALRGDR